MKRIVKNAAPSSLTTWLHDQNGLNCSFKRDMTTALKDEVKQSLLDEQGYLCCYTGKRIEMETSHIEHLKPQTLSLRYGDHDDVNYQNMLAAYPKQLIEKDKETGKSKGVNCEFGAQIRGDKELLVTPLQENCEQKFSFDEFGDIFPAHENDDAAKTTIEVLKLQHKDLIAGRKAVIDGILLADYLTEAQVRTAAERAMERDGENRFKQFCFVLKIACDLRLKKFRKERTRRKYIRQSKKRK